MWPTEEQGVFIKQTSEGFVGYIEAYPEVVVQGSTRAEVMRRMTSAVDLAKQVRKEERRNSIDGKLERFGNALKELEKELPKEQYEKVLQLIADILNNEIVDKVKLK